MQFEWAPPETVGWSISAFAVLAAVTFTIVRVASAIRGASDITPAERSRFRLYEDAWNDSDLPAIVQMGLKLIGPQFPTAIWIRERAVRNIDILRVARPVVATNRLCGYVMLYPLTANAARMIEQGMIRSGTDLKPADMCRSFARARAIYVGMLVGEDRLARAFVLELLRRRLRSLHGIAPILTVYGKPATTDGARLLRKFGFEPIAGNDAIFATPYEALHRLLSA